MLSPTYPFQALFAGVQKNETIIIKITDFPPKTDHLDAKKRLG